METWEILCIVCLALVGGMYWGPWLALTRSMSTFEPEVFLAIVKRMSKNVAPVMTFLIPVALLSTVPVLLLSYNSRPEMFYLTVAALALLLVTLLVTVIVEVPIVTKIETWTVETLPANWRQLRDRWGAFHWLRVAPAIVGLVLLLIGVLS